MGLAPSEVMATLKAELGKQGIRPVPEETIQPDPFLPYKRVPVKRLVARLGLAAFDKEAPYLGTAPEPEKVRLLLSQHLGKPSVPLVQVGQRVKRGEPVAGIPEKSLGAALHASMDGTVTTIDDKAIEITKGGAV